MPALHRVAHRCGSRSGLPCSTHVACGRRPQPADAFGDLRAAGADQAADAKDFALAQFEIDIVETVAVAKAANREHRVARPLVGRLLGG